MLEKLRGTRIIYQSKHGYIAFGAWFVVLIVIIGRSTNWDDVYAFVPSYHVGGQWRNEKHILKTKQSINRFLNQQLTNNNNNNNNNVDRCILLLRCASTNSNNDRRTLNDNNMVDADIGCSNRRRFMSLPLSLLAIQYTTRTDIAYARGLVEFPCKKGLANAYHFLRVGTTLLEEEGMWSTNPLFLTNRDDALSVQGEDQIVAACQQLAMLNRAPTVVKYSLAASCIDTSDIVQRELKLGRDRMIPEFTFLDPRGVGGWDMTSKVQVEPAVWALDHDEAGVDGIGARPPPNDDGTPNETLADQAIRLRQLLSILESQYSGDTILLIFPDGTGPALLSAMIAGIPYNRVHQLEYSPGEVRFDITYESTRKLWKEQQQLPVSSEGSGITYYEQKLEEGRKALRELRAAAPENGGSGYINLKDAKLEKERLEVEKVVQEKYQRQRQAEAEAAQRRQTIQRQLQQKQESDGSTSSSNLLPVLSVGGALAITGLVISATRNDPTIAVETEKSNVNGQQSILGTNNASITGFNSTEIPIAVLIQGSDGIIESVKGNSLYASPISTNSNGYYQQPPPVLDPQEAADRAMQEYLDRDDGGDDWLQVMANIMVEPDEDTIVEDDNDNAFS